MFDRAGGSELERAEPLPSGKTFGRAASDLLLHLLPAGDREVHGNQILQHRAALRLRRDGTFRPFKTCISKRVPSGRMTRSSRTTTLPRTVRSGVTGAPPRLLISLDDTPSATQSIRVQPATFPLLG